MEEKLVKSKQRVADHGEVFTPAWLVDSMLDLVKVESERIDSRFLEPACGSGNFLVAVLRRKLETVDKRYGKSEFEWRHYGLLAVMSIYGIELLADNTEECRENLLDVYRDHFKMQPDDVWTKAASNVLAVNVINGDALTLTFTNGQDLVFPEWGYLGKGLFQRRDFGYRSLTKRSSLGEGMFEDFDEKALNLQDNLKSVQDYAPMTVEEIAK